MITYLFYQIWALFAIRTTLRDQAANVLAVKNSEPSIYRYTTHVKTTEPNMTKEADGTREERRKGGKQCYLMPKTLGNQ
jgi:hypothetical protein